MIPGMKFPPSLEALLSELSIFPWRDTAITRRNRFREDRVSLTASSPTFATSIALVSFFTVALAVFTVFSMFSTLQVSLQAWLAKSSIPDDIACQVLSYLTQFSGQASKLGGVGLVVLLLTAASLILTIDRTLNGNWRALQPRPLAQRMLIYWAAITLGPLVLAASLTVTSYIVSASSGLVGALPISVRAVLDVAQLFLVAGGMAALYRYAPGTSCQMAACFSGYFVRGNRVGDWQESA